MDKFKTDKDWGKLARWLQTNPSTRHQADLDNWLALADENEAAYNIWRQTKLSSRTADSGAPTIEDIWPDLKEELGIHRKKTRKKSKSRSSKRRSSGTAIFGSAWFVALAAMAGLTLLVLFLRVMRGTIGFY